MRKQINHVKLFHESFGIENKTRPSSNLSEKVYNLRYNLMKEENDEYLDACEKGDMVEIADALGDMMYILCGTILSHGLQGKIEEILKKFKEVICLS